MLLKDTANSIVAILALSSFATAAPGRMARQSATELSLTAKLQLADKSFDRYDLLPGDDDFIFDLGKDGLADRKSFPALVGTGAALSITEIPACGMASLHIHPRADELFLVIEGRIDAGMVPESGVVDADKKPRVVHTELGPKQMTIFPKGSLHVQMNPECTPALIVASFTSEDPGASLIAPQMFALDDSTIASTFGQSIAGEDIDKVRDAIPKDVIFKVEECLKTCDLKRRV